MLNTVDSGYLEVEGALRNTLTYQIFGIEESTNHTTKFH